MFEPAAPEATSLLRKAILAQSMAKLIFIDRDFMGQVYQLAVEKTTVGRADQNTLVLRHETVSSHHCEILTNGPEVIVRDLGSRNGTYINGAKFQGQRQVKSGQTIRFGTVEARLELDPDSSYEPETDETAVRLHWKVIRDARREQNAAPSPQPVARISHDPGPPSDEPTILLPKSAVQPAQSIPAVQNNPESPARRPGKPMWIWVLIALGVLGFLGWLLTRS
jgi:pSer/pThr/pTyr-binding forkhead associated (FHA) protein